MMKKINATILVAKYTDKFSYYDDWLEAFQTNNKLNLTIIDAHDPKNAQKENLKKIETSELIIIHHSLLADTLQFLKPFKKALTCRQGILLSFVGNEVNLPAIQMAGKLDVLKEIAPNYIATQLLQEAGDWLYSECPESKVLSVPHALNARVFKPEIDFLQRKIDIGCRTALYGVYLGDNDRNRIIHYFNTLAQSKNLVVDLETNPKERFTRFEWAQFLNNCKATISTEAGSFYLEKDESLIKEILLHFRKKGNILALPPESSFFVKCYRALTPKFIRKMVRRNLSPIILGDDCLGNEQHYQEVLEKFFKNRNKAPVYTKCISSRHFDAIGTKTIQIMFQGRFNDILEPNHHYIALNSNYSNIEEVLTTLSSQKKVQDIVDAAYHHVTTKHTYPHRITYILESLFS